MPPRTHFVNEGRKGAFHFHPTSGVLAALALLLTVPLHAQQGDVKDASDTVQRDPIPAEKIPPSPPLSPADALKTLRTQPGFHIDLAASEPLVQNPIAMTFGPDGRAWVVEMSGYMSNVDGTGEDQPVGKIVILESSQGDGNWDRRVVFTDKLVLPRALALANGGLLVAEPPHLWFYPIIDGNKAGKRSEVAKDLGNNYNPQGEANGLMWGLDNWIYCAAYPGRFRAVDGEWQRGASVQRGEWGISQDDYGRIVYNSNEDQFRIDLVPAEYWLRNPNCRTWLGVDIDPIHDQTVWPVHVTPGVNRGYRKGILRADGTLAKTTAACGPLIYRGDNFPSEYRGNAFVCEPAGNLVIRDILVEHDGEITGRKAYEREDFLASTDERFRPTSLYNGPDGALYVTDFYHGVLEHRLSLTTYLRRQILARRLENPLGLGRIYRVYYGENPPARQTLQGLNSEHLVAKLASAKGWEQDTAQRLLVENPNPSAASQLRFQAIHSSDPVAQIHSAWTLQGMDLLDLATVLQLLDDHQAKVRVAAVRLSEPYMKSPKAAELFRRLLKLAESENSREVQRQLAFSLGQADGTEDDRVLLALADRAAGDSIARQAIASSLYQRELQFLTALLDHWSRSQPGFGALLGLLAQCVINERDLDHADRLLQSAAKAESWQQAAIFDGIADRVGGASRHWKPLYFPSEPAGWLALERSAGASSALERLSPLLGWPGKPGYVPPPPIPELTVEERQRFETGKGLFATTCAVCHQASGLGQPGVAPPLADSEWVMGSEQRLARIVLQGAEGPIRAAGVSFDSSMPSWASLNDGQIASLLTFIRRSWENTASPIDPAVIAAIRAHGGEHPRAWTGPELLTIP